MASLVNFDYYAATCAPQVAVSTLRALATVESSFNQFAIGVVKGSLKRQPRNLLEGISTAKSLEAAGYKFSAGLIQIYVKNWPSLGLDAESVFEPCANMAAAQKILVDCYRRAAPQRDSEQAALRRAISCYYSNNFYTGFREGYVQKVVAAAHSFRASAQKTPVYQVSSPPLGDFSL